MRPLRALLALFFTHFGNSNNVQSLQTKDFVKTQHRIKMLSVQRLYSPSAFKYVKQHTYYIVALGLLFMHAESIPMVCIGQSCRFSYIKIAEGAEGFKKDFTLLKNH